MSGKKKKNGVLFRDGGIAVESPAGYWISREEGGRHPAELTPLEFKW
jgi:hypothetical protein